jgi:CRP/FNR family transcriptional regulator, cyclic AMP receptor protein
LADLVALQSTGLPSDPSSQRGREFAVGDLLFREGERGEEMYVIQSGAVQIVKRVGGQDRPLATLGKGEFVGEMAILNGRPRTATALALERTRCLLIDAETLEQMVANSAEIALRLVKKLARRLESADEMIQILLDPDPRARVLRALKRYAEASLAEASDKGVNGPQTIPIRASLDDLAGQVGVDRAQVRDVLSRLRRLRVADEDGGGNIVLLDLPRLLEFMEFLEMPGRGEG